MIYKQCVAVLEYDMYRNICCPRLRETMITNCFDGMWRIQITFVVVVVVVVVAVLVVLIWFSRFSVCLLFSMFANSFADLSRICCL